MAENSNISWTTHTFNPWIGCSKVSAGCANCYAEQLMDKTYRKVEWGPSGTRKRTSAANWKMPLKWNREAAESGERPRVFCASLADVFEHREELQPWRDDLWRLIEMCPNLDWLLLTKRPANVMHFVPYRWCNKGGWPENVWMGASAENQLQFDARAPHLCRIPAKVRFVSAEPMLESFRMHHEFDGLCVRNWLCDDGIHWVIVGGESGANRRDCGVDAIVNVARQCEAAGVPCFVKQDCAMRPGQQGRIPDDVWAIKQFPLPLKRNPSA